MTLDSTLPVFLRIDGSVRSNYRPLALFTHRVPPTLTTSVIVVPVGSWIHILLAIAAGPTAHWLCRTHGLASKLSTIASRMCGRRNRAVKHVHVSPLLRRFVVLGLGLTQS